MTTVIRNRRTKEEQRPNLFGLCLARRRKTKSTNAAYIQNFDKTPTAKSANPDLISQCIEAKTRHNSVSVKIVPYHKSPLLIETHDMATEAMAKTRKEYHHDIQ